MSSGSRLQPRIERVAEAAGELAGQLEYARQPGPFQLVWQQSPFAARTPAQGTCVKACCGLLGQLAEFLSTVTGDDDATAQVVHSMLARSAARSASLVMNWLLQQPELLAAALKQFPASAQAPLNSEQAVNAQLWRASLSILNSMAVKAAQLASTDGASAAARIMQQMEQAGVWIDLYMDLYTCLTKVVPAMGLLLVQWVHEFTEFTRVRLHAGLLHTVRKGCVDMYVQANSWHHSKCFFGWGGMPS
jgi:hypothetical protein